MRSGNNRDGSVFCRWSGWKRCPPCQLDSPANAVWRHGTVWGTKAKPSAWNTDGFAVPRTSGIVTLTALSVPKQSAWAGSYLLLAFYAKATGSRAYAR